TGVARCFYCQGRIHASETTAGRRRVECYNRGQGKACTQQSAFLDLYEDQVAEFLDAFHIPEDYQAQILEMRQKTLAALLDVEKHRQTLQARLNRIRKLFEWGDKPEAEYLAERETIQRELRQLAPSQNDEAVRLPK